MKKITHAKEYEWQHPIGDGTVLLVMVVLEPHEPIQNLSRSHRTFVLATMGRDGAKHRYGEMLESGELSKVSTNVPTGPEIENALAELRLWICARVVMSS
jgi:hypothetical protein